METKLILALVELLLRVGPKVFISSIRALQVDEPSVDDIKALMVNAPEDYLNG